MMFKMIDTVPFPLLGPGYRQNRGHGALQRSQDGTGWADVWGRSAGREGADRSHLIGRPTPTASPDWP